MLSFRRASPFPLFDSEVGLAEPIFLHFLGDVRGPGLMALLAKARGVERLARQACRQPRHCHYRGGKLWGGCQAGHADRRGPKPRLASGARPTADAGNVTVQCPGKIQVRAGKKSLTGANTLSHDMSQWPHSTPFDEELVLRWPYDQVPVKNRRFEILRGDGTVVRGTTDEQGKTGLQKSQFPEGLVVRLLPED